MIDHHYHGAAAVASRRPGKRGAQVSIVRYDNTRTVYTILHREFCVIERGRIVSMSVCVHSFEKHVLLTIIVLWVSWRRLINMFDQIILLQVQNSYMSRVIACADSDFRGPSVK